MYEKKMKESEGQNVRFWCLDNFGALSSSSLLG